ncbi:MAG: hypothetical protein ACSHWQ_09595 [Spongiibacteraceae bacterium]
MLLIQLALFSLFHSIEITARLLTQLYRELQPLLKTTTKSSAIAKSYIYIITGNGAPPRDDLRGKYDLINFVFGALSMIRARNDWNEHDAHKDISGMEYILAVGESRRLPKNTLAYYTK